MKKLPPVRILIVEDNLARETLLKSWLPEGVRTAVVTSAGSAVAKKLSSLTTSVMLWHVLWKRGFLWPLWIWAE